MGSISMRSTSVTSSSDFVSRRMTYCSTWYLIPEIWLVSNCMIKKLKMAAAAILNFITSGIAHEAWCRMVSYVYILWFKYLWAFWDNGVSYCLDSCGSGVSDLLERRPTYKTFRPPAKTVWSPTFRRQISWRSKLPLPNYADFHFALV